ncbi:uncharacterized protein LOC136042298 [Artemia franciscana]|uniref:uncharacterized protein LOC136042298 n=1 Tax=Artemia franciscana TaxID=6661 RepID=UPI0032DA9114
MGTDREASLIQLFTYCLTLFSADKEVSNAVKPLDAKDTYPSTTAIIDAKGAREVANAVNILKEEKNVQPIGQEFVKELKTDEGSFVNYHCKLCDCRITDPTAKDQHIKGRRHRLAYNKKVSSEHLDGQKHKNNEALAKTDRIAIAVPKKAALLRCELCDIACSGSNAYAAHIGGAKHQKAVKHHTRLGATKKAAKHDVASQVLQAFYPNVTATEDSSSSKQEPGTNQALADEISTVRPVVPQLPKDYASPADRLYRLDSTLVFKDEKKDTLYGFNCSVTKDGKTFTGRGVTKKAAKHDVASQVLQAFYPNVTATEDSSSSKQEPGINQALADEISAVSPVVPQLPKDSASPADRLYRLDSTLVFKDEKRDTLHGFNISVTKDGKTFTGRGVTKKAAKHDVASQVLQAFYPNVTATEDSSSSKQEPGTTQTFADQISTIDPVVPELTTDSSSPADRLYRLDSTLVFKDEKWDTLHGFNISVTKDGKTFTGREDERQLRPTTSSFKLEKDCVAVSLFEAALKNNFFVKKYPTIKGMNKNIFFLSHDVFEKEDEEQKSMFNHHEAEIALNLAKYLTKQYYSQNQITVLATCYRQQLYLRKLQKKSFENLSKIRISVVGNYLGEKDDIIILSLVGSNKDSNLDFLSTVNSYVKSVCSGLSHAKHGLYMIGNIECLKSQSELWNRIYTTLNDMKKIGNQLDLVCQVHDTVTQVRNASDFAAVTDGGCMQKCYAILNCGHLCQRICHFDDRDHLQYQCNKTCDRYICSEKHRCPRKCFEECEKCTIKIEKTLPCGHTATLPCFVDSLDYKCYVMVEEVLPDCGHLIQLHCQYRKLCANFSTFCSKQCNILLPCGHQCTRKCHVNDDPEHKKYVCKKKCEKKNKGCKGDHQCRRLCSEDCMKCEVAIKAALPCGHETRIECGADIQKHICTVEVKQVFPKCQHTITTSCFAQRDSKIHFVTAILPCGHEARLECGADIQKYICTVECKQVLPECQHTITKPCYRVQEYVDLSKSFDDSKNQTMPESSWLSRLWSRSSAKQTKDTSSVSAKLICVEPCRKKVKCGHYCPNLCGDPCIMPSDCLICYKIKEEKDKSEKETRKRQLETYQEIAQQKALEYRNETTRFKVSGLDPSSSVFVDVRDKVLKYIQPAHSWYPEVTSVQEVFNANLLEAFYLCQTNLFEPSTSREKFHGTNTEACENIITNGFRLPRNDGQQRMFGCGIYFATDSSKSAQQIYTKGSNILILCDVLLGKEMKVSTPQYTMTYNTIRSLGYDSLFAPRDTKSAGGVLFDEFVIYDPRQAYPRYIINFKATQMGVPVGSILSAKFQKHEIYPSRYFNPSNELDYHFRVAEAQFRRLCQNRDVIKVTYVRNPALESQFLETSKQFAAKYGAGAKQANPILAFHGTPIEKNIESILKNNFQRSYIKRTAYGHGHYFSEFPETALEYAGSVKALILCKILAGRSQDVTGNTLLTNGYDSLRVKKDAFGRGTMIIIDNEKQILPQYVVHIN